MYKFLKSKLKWNAVTIRIVWSLMIAFSFVLWYYSFKLFDFTLKLATQIVFS